MRNGQVTRVTGRRSDARLHDPCPMVWAMAP